MALHKVRIFYGTLCCACCKDDRRALTQWPPDETAKREISFSFNHFIKITWQSYFIQFMETPSTMQDQMFKIFTALQRNNHWNSSSVLTKLFFYLLDS